MPTYNVDDALKNHDVESFKEALDAGWTIPYVENPVPALDSLYPKRCISDKWTEGFRLMAEVHPELYKDELLMKIAIRSGAVDILALFFENGWLPGSKLDQAYTCTYEGDAEPRVYASTVYDFAVRLIGRIEDPSNIISEAELISVLELMQKYGQSLFVPHPGILHKAGLYNPDGKVPWVFAMDLGVLEVAGHFFPKNLKEVEKTPNGFEEIEKVLHKWSKENKETPYTMNYTTGKVKEIWFDFISKNLEDYLKHYPSLPYVRSLDLQSIPIFDAEKRRHVWERWSAVHTEGWTSLHDLVLEDDRKLVRKVLALMVEDNAPCLTKWNSQDPDGVTPSMLWSQKNPLAPEADYEKSLNLEMARKAIQENLQATA